MIFAAWKLTQIGHPPPNRPAPSPALDFGPKRKAFFEKEIAPLIATENDRNSGSDYQSGGAVRRGLCNLSKTRSGVRRCADPVGDQVSNHEGYGEG